MTLILLATGSAGFLVSFALLHAGLTRMWVRYPVAILSAYAVFLLLLRLWLAAQSRRKSSSDLDVDLTGVDLTGADLSGVVADSEQADEQPAEVREPSRAYVADETQAAEGVVEGAGGRAG